jgi:starch synthase
LLRSAPNSDLIPKVTIVVPGRWHAFDLARELEGQGALHRLITNYPRSRTRLWKIPDEKVVSRPFTALLTRLAWKLGGEHLAMRSQYMINNIFAQQAAGNIGAPDVIHAWSAAAEPSLQAAKARGIQCVLERSSSHMLEQCRLLRSEYNALGLRWVETPKETVDRELREYQIADCIFVPSKFVRQSFEAARYPVDRLFVNGFGVDLSLFRPGKKQDEKFRVIYVGSLSIRKGVHHLVKAFKLANIEKSELLLVGGKSDESEQLIGSPDPRICVVGHVPQRELPSYYHKASVFVMASIEEGQAMVQAQALACGLPLICTSSTGGEDLLALNSTANNVVAGMQEFAAGIVVNPGDATLLAAALRRIAGEPSLLASMRLNAAELARRDLTWHRYAVANLRKYDELLRSDPIASLH